MPLKVTTKKDDSTFSFGDVSNSGTVVGAKGGTEMMMEGLVQRLPETLTEQFNIIPSRVRDVSEDKHNILWLHDLFQDPEVNHLKDPKSRERFKKLIFVSNWQFSTYHFGLGVPYRESLVLKNAIEPLPDHKKPKDQINLIYHTTPHRGLELLVPAFEHLCLELSGTHDLHLDVYSSFDIYGWGQRDEPFKPLFQRIKDHPKMTYHGARPNSEVRKALEDAHIFAYPSIWQETSCIALIEAMSARCAVVHPSLAALPETSAGFGLQYPWHEDPSEHINHFAYVLKMAISNYHDTQHQEKLKFQKMYIDNFYNWDLRAAEWRGLLESIVASN